VIGVVKSFLDKGVYKDGDDGDDVVEAQWSEKHAVK